MSNLLSIDEYVQGVRSGNIAVLSKAITLAESTLQQHQEIAAQIIEKCLPFTGKSVRIGITGVPGVGKSSFIEKFGVFLADNQKKKVAVLAIDPSSGLSKGSILGDKTRMEKLSVHPKAFIRPSPAGQSLGGVARKTREAIYLCEAAGFDLIIVETVGVGQSETAVHSMVDFFLLLMLSGAGDELQGIKRGIMEMADALVITKTDGANIDKAKLAAIEYKRAMHLLPPHAAGWIPETGTCSSLTGEGMADVWEIIERYCLHANTNGYLQEKRNNQAVYWMDETINEGIRSMFFGNEKISLAHKKMVEALKTGKVTSYSAAHNILQLIKNQ